MFTHEHLPPLAHYKRLKKTAQQEKRFTAFLLEQGNAFLVRTA
jgi:hypothetical protein